MFYISLFLIIISFIKEIRGGGGFIHGPAQGQLLGGTTVVINQAPPAVVINQSVPMQQGYTPVPQVQQYPPQLYPQQPEGYPQKPLHILADAFC